MPFCDSQPEGYLCFDEIGWHIFFAAGDESFVRMMRNMLPMLFAYWVECSVRYSGIQRWVQRDTALGTAGYSVGYSVSTADGGFGDVFG
jgi:hypothetical protein